MQRLAQAMALTLGTLAAPLAASAAPVAYNFQGTLNAAVGGSTVVGGTFTFDTATTTLSAASIAGAGTTFTAANASASSFTGVNPAGSFVKLDFTQSSSILSLIFDSNITQFYTDRVSVSANGSFNSITRDDFTLSRFSSGTVSPVITAVPEPVSLALLAAGLGSLALTRRRRAVAPQQA